MNPNRTEPVIFYLSEPEPNLNLENGAPVNPNQTWTAKIFWAGTKPEPEPLFETVRHPGFYTSDQIWLFMFGHFSKFLLICDFNLWQTSLPWIYVSKDALNHFWVHSSAKNSLKRAKNVVFFLFCVLVDRLIEEAIAWLRYCRGNCITFHYHAHILFFRVHTDISTVMSEH